MEEPGEPVLRGLERRFARLTIPEAEIDQNIFQSPEDMGTIPLAPQRPSTKFRNLAWKREKELDLFEIDNIEVGLYSTELIRKYSVIEVNNPDDDGPNSVRDPRLGPRNNSETCETCHKDILSCPGHMGYITIPKIPHPLIIPKIILVLSCVCNSCGSLLVKKEDLKDIDHLTGIAKLQAIKNHIQSRSTIQCNYNLRMKGTRSVKCEPIPIYINNREKKDDYRLTYTYPGPSKKQYPRDPEEVYEILHSISEEDARLMGFLEDQHPRDMIMEAMIVIPYCARPDLFQGKNVMHDDLSTMYKDIVKTAALYFKTKEEQPKDIAMQSLYFKISHFMKNDGRYNQGGTKAYIDVVKRLQGKTAIIRFNIMGKRVNFAGRTVIGPSAYLRVDEIGVPRLMSVKLTRPISVQPFNREELQSKYDSGKVMAITTFQTGKRMTIEYFRSKNLEYQLQDGDIVERQLEDGDLVLVNRAPTLHKYNFLALKTRLIDDRIIRLPLSVTTPQNADFDGDEMNIHVPQTIEAYAEAGQLLSIYQNLMSSRDNKPIMAIVYNSLTAAYLLTYPEHVVDTYPKEIDKLRDQMSKHDQETKEYQKLTRSLEEKDAHLNKYREKIMIDPIVFNQAIEFVVSSPQFKTLKTRVRKHGVKWGSGKSLFSSTLPEDFYYNSKGVVIREGVLISGLLSKKVLGTVDGGIISEMVKQLGPIITVDFMSDVQFVLREFLSQRGFTVGLEDCLPANKETQEIITEAIETAKMKVLSLAGKPPNKLMAEHQERKTMEYLDIAKTLGDNLIQTTLHPENALVIMANSGSKGSGFNAAQMSSLLGQTKVSGKRIPANLAGNRSLPVFEPNDPDPRARGFCVKSFGSGLDPPEFFFHAQGGREGLTDTAINTSQTGFLQHQIIRAAEDIHINPDGSVRTDTNAIVQFVYGEDGMDASQLGEINIRGTGIPFFRNIFQLADKINHKYS